MRKTRNKADLEEFFQKEVNSFRDNTIKCYTFTWYQSKRAFSGELWFKISSWDCYQEIWAAPKYKSYQEKYYWQRKFSFLTSGSENISKEIINLDNKKK